MAQQHDLFDDIIDITKGIDVLKDPLGGVTDALLGTATTGAPVRSEPKLGNACAQWPSVKAATLSISAAVTTPCPPRPWILI